MSGSFESVRWNACVHRLDLGLYSHPKEFIGEWSSEPMLSPKDKSPLQAKKKKKSPEEDRTSFCLCVCLSLSLPGCLSVFFLSLFTQNHALR